MVCGVNSSAGIPEKGPQSAAAIFTRNRRQLIFCGRTRGGGTNDNVAENVAVFPSLDQIAFDKSRVLWLRRFVGRGAESFYGVRKARVGFSVRLHGVRELLD